MLLNYINYLKTVNISVKESHTDILFHILQLVLLII